MAIPRIFLDKRTGKIRTALFSNGIEERFDVFTGKLRLLRESIAPSAPLYLRTDGTSVFNRTDGTSVYNRP